MTQRRFELTRSHPEDVKSLALDHPAIVGARTMFPSTVVSPADSPSLLISGHNNRKIGKVVTKGEWAGMPIYTLTLEERATCPSTCFMYSKCYGNAMHMARRHLHGQELELYLKAELVDLADEHTDGFVVRLHVLGDFYSVEYVRFWQRMLGELPELRIFGYTARNIGTADGIGSAIAVLNGAYPSRSFIRFSSDKAQPMGATVIDRLPEGSVVPEGVVCPAETSDSDCCATCGLCWSPSMKLKTIVFVAHGMGASEKKAALREHAPVSKEGLRQVKPFSTGLKLWDAPVGKIVEVRDVAPSDLWVDEKYQRNLSRKSADLITKIAKGWNWRKFNLPTVVEDEDGTLHVIDGQHTAIAAASRPDITTFPVKIVDAESIESRADTFVGINRDRVAVTNTQIFFAEIAAGGEEAVAVKRMCDAADVIVLRQPPNNNEYGPGETMAIMTLRRLYRNHGETFGARVLNICVEGGVIPLSEWCISAVAILLSEPRFEPRMTDEDIWTVMRGLGRQLLVEAHIRRAEHLENLPASAAEVIWSKKS